MFHIFASYKLCKGIALSINSLLRHAYLSLFDFFKIPINEHRLGTFFLLISPQEPGGIFINKTMKQLFSAFILVLCLLSCSSEKEEPKYSIFGTITNSTTGKPIPNASISLSPLNVSTRSGSDGYYEFKEIESGQYKLQVTANGYVSVTRQINITEGSNLSYDIQLIPESSTPGTDDETNETDPTPNEPEDSDDDLQPDEEETLYSIFGTITNFSTGSPVANATITLSPKNVFTTSNTAGYYEFNEVESGQYDLEIIADNFVTTSRRINMTQGSNLSYDIQLVPKSDNTETPDDDTQNPIEPDAPIIQDYSEAIVTTDHSYLDVNLVSCIRNGSNIVLTYTLTNTHSSSTMGISISNVNTVTQKTTIADNIGNQYAQSAVKINLAGRDWGYGNNIDGQLLPGIPAKCEITVKNVDSSATYMTYYISTSTAFPGSVNYTLDVVLRNVKIY